jgi:hypothetical protein
MDRQADGYFYIQANNYTIPSNVTTYILICFSWDYLVEQGVPENATTITIIGVEPHLHPRGGRLLHHATIAGSDKEAEGSECLSTGYQRLLYTWTQGELP